MSVKVMGRVWDSDLAPNLRLVLLAYADAAEHDGSRSYPGWERLSQMTGYSRSQIERITTKLVRSGYIEKVRPGRKGQRAEFRVVLETLPEVSQDAPQSEGIVSHPSGDSVAQLRDTSRPDPSYTSPNGDGLFEAFYHYWTGNKYVTGMQIPKSMRGRLNAAVKEARLAGIDKTEVYERGQRYRDLWRGLEPSPQALLANWHRFAPDPVVPECAKCENSGLLWVDSDGNPTEPDDPFGASAVRCPECAA